MENVDNNTAKDFNILATNLNVYLYI